MNTYNYSICDYRMSNTGKISIQHFEEKIVTCITHIQAKNAGSCPSLRNKICPAVIAKQMNLIIILPYSSFCIPQLCGKQMENIPLHAPGDKFLTYLCKHQLSLHLDISGLGA